MPFEPGHRKMGGRSKGIKNKKTIAFEERVKELNFDIVGGLVWAAQEAAEQYASYKDKVESGRYSPMEDQAPKYLNIYVSTVKELASYIYCKPKSVEITTPEGSGGIKVIVEDYTTKKEV